MDLGLIPKLFFSLFSLNRGNMRWFNLKRIAASVILLPLFVCLFAINRTFLCLDHLFFFKFTSIKIRRSIFIVSAPRSASTYLLHKLASQSLKVTSFKLWEILFAPSIIQKFFVIGLMRIDGIFGSPLRKSVLYFEKNLIGRLKQIHLIGLNLPEEDEAILLWNLTTTCLNFFFPDTKLFDNYFLFDDLIKPSTQKRIIKYYYGCVQRHSYVFNRTGEKYFLSKNPAMMSKLKSLHHFFPDATILNVNRNPARTIPSAIALHNYVYSLFTSRLPSSQVNEKMKQILIQWYKMANENLKKYYGFHLIEIDFNKLVTNDSETISRICDIIHVDKSIFLKQVQKEPVENLHISQNKYLAFDAMELKEILKELPFLTKYCSELSYDCARA